MHRRLGKNVRIGKGKRSATIAAAALLAAGVAALPAAGAAAAEPANYDGAYAGTQSLSERSSDQNYSKCLKGPFKRKLVVKGGEATYIYNPTYQGAVTGKVSADGDVSASDPSATGGVSLAGKIEGDAFTGEVWSVYCTYSVKLRRMPQ
jgi:hypothetical protein